MSYIYFDLLKVMTLSCLPRPFHRPKRRDRDGRNCQSLCRRGHRDCHGLHGGDRRAGTAQAKTP